MVYVGGGLSFPCKNLPQGIDLMKKMNCKRVVPVGRHPFSTSMFNDFQLAKGPNSWRLNHFDPILPNFFLTIDFQNFECLERVPFPHKSGQVATVRRIKSTGERHCAIQRLKEGRVEKGDPFFCHFR